MTPGANAAPPRTDTTDPSNPWSRPLPAAVPDRPADSGGPPPGAARSRRPAPAEGPIPNGGTMRHSVKHEASYDWASG